MNIRLVHICTEMPELLNTRVLVIRCAVYPDSLNNFITVWSDNLPSPTKDYSVHRVRQVALFTVMVINLIFDWWYW